MQPATTNDDLMQRMNEQLKRISHDVVHVSSTLSTQNRSASPAHGHPGISCEPRHAMLVLQLQAQNSCSILTACAWMQFLSHSCLSTQSGYLCLPCFFLSFPPDSSLPPLLCRSYHPSPLLPLLEAETVDRSMSQQQMKTIQVLQDQLMFTRNQLQMAQHENSVQRQEVRKLLDQQEGDSLPCTFFDTHVLTVHCDVHLGFACAVLARIQETLP